MKNRTLLRRLNRTLASLSSYPSKAAITCYSTYPPKARLNVPTDYSTTPLLAHSSQTALNTSELPPDVKNGTTKRMNLFQAINDALATALVEDENVLIFGEDVAFGGVFRCTMKLAENFGSERVFNTPLTEQGIMGFGIGLAAEGMRPVAEIQFADYVYPAFDQLVNEAAKYRYREGKTGRSAGGLTVRMPCGGVGHGALYHSQSPESLFTHIPGLRVIMPRSPLQAKGLLLSAIRSNDPCVFMEPKILYRAAVEQVPTSPYTLPLSKAEILKPGENVTIISYGQPLYTCHAALAKAEQDLGISVELIDLRTLYPWDRETIFKSVRKTGRCMIVHEAMINAGIGAEVSAAIQGDTETFLRLEAPVTRVAGWSIHTPLMFEKFNIPDVANIKTLTINEPELVSELGPAFERYNEEQFATVKLPGSSQSVVISTHNSLGDGRYFDPESASSFAFDHTTQQKASDVQSYVLDGPQAELVYVVAECDMPGFWGLGERTHSLSFFLGFTASIPSRTTRKLPSSSCPTSTARTTFGMTTKPLEGSIKAPPVHSLRGGAMGLLTNKSPPSAPGPLGTGRGAIPPKPSQRGKKYQEELNRGFTNLSEGAFKGLRRQLPVTRQKIEWDKVASYRVGQEI
ncbi:hypothetical protein RRF57_001845 [Xylaria bambusicola]|uniref:3-methyl-2-oxobutanoate dehydrogenase (2-methylpropanoyl-transferring) n=1 Tax=Xylaria bambusicola TaxID=326684 RepID=A0AAN7U5I2_9PEZI